MTREEYAEKLGGVTTKLFRLYPADLLEFISPSKYTITGYGLSGISLRLTAEEWAEFLDTADAIFGVRGVSFKDSVFYFSESFPSTEKRFSKLETA